MKQPRPFNKELLKKQIKLMKTTYQIPNEQTIWEHGLSVALHYKKLIQDLKNISQGINPIHNLFIPEFLKENASFFLKNVTLDSKLIQKYLVFHDIGKPLCIEQDSYG
jgi:hypothetical protein